LQGFDEDGIALISTTLSEPNGREESSIRRSLLCPPMPSTRVSGSQDKGKGKGSSDEITNGYKSFYSVDAFHYGGVCRFFNHNCQPNCMLRGCYVNEGDPTKPLLAIFAVRTIEPGEPITISYTGDLGIDDADFKEAANMPASVAAKGKGKGKKGKKAVKKVVAEKRTCWCGGCTLL
jgi:hypothetical protein